MESLLVALGLLVPASVTLVGYWAKGQSEKRIEEERRRETARLGQQHRDEQARLQLDAAMRAAGLFQPAESESSPATVVAALLALTRLDHADLAVSLLIDLWKPDDVAHGSTETGHTLSTEAAILVIDHALGTSESPDARIIAAELLCRHAEFLDPCRTLNWPSSIDGLWLPDLPPRAKLLIMDALVQMTIHSEANENALRAVAVRLFGVWDRDSDARVKGCVGKLVSALLPALERLDYNDLMQGQRLVTIDEFRHAATTAQANPDGHLERLVNDRARSLAAWSDACRSCTPGPGALATAAT